ncbi:ATP-binding protein [Streptomyces hydrogenans]|uniref:ATP-binding protein n=1 Tax=Streptomyces hydrogenans TaxID=1873719 RepID=UPI00332FC203
MLDVASRRPEFYFTTEPDQSRVLPCAPESVAVARRLVAAVLARWELPHLTDRAVLIASELVTNAVVHARTNKASIRVIVTRIDTSRVQVAVTDLDPRLPAAGKAAGPTATHGRGLALVASLSECWGVVPLHWGKSVWAEVGSEP